MSAHLRPLDISLYFKVFGITALTFSGLTNNIVVSSFGDISKAPGANCVFIIYSIFYILLLFLEFVEVILKLFIGKNRIDGYIGKKD